MLKNVWVVRQFDHVNNFFVLNRRERKIIAHINIIRIRAFKQSSDFFSVCFVEGIFDVIFDLTPDSRSPCFTLLLKSRVLLLLMSFSLLFVIWYLHCVTCCLFIVDDMIEMDLHRRLLSSVLPPFIKTFNAWRWAFPPVNKRENISLTQFLKTKGTRREHDKN